MIKNYFKIAVRNLLKNKVFASINIFGLAVGFTCCLLISGFLYSELSYDKFPKDAKDIYRVEINLENKDFYSGVDVAVGRGIKNAYPEVLDFARLIQRKDIFVKYENNQFKEEGIAFVDSNFLQLFSMPFVKGDVATALNQPNCVVISQQVAKKYFGTADPMGKLLVFNSNAANPFKVTGVIGELPGNLHFNFDFYISFKDNPNNQTWSNVGDYTYIKLKPGTDPKKLEAKFPELVAKYVVPEVQRDMGVSLAEAQKSVNTFVFYLKPIEKIHLYSANKDELSVNGSIKYVYIFAALALFIILLAAVNFTNLSTAASIKRSKEVGIRKVMGSDKKQLVLQFLSESLLLTFVAYVIALGFVYLSLPFFNTLAGKELVFSAFLNYKVILVSLAFVAIVGILAGTYPAFFLSSFNIISILKGKKNATPQSSRHLRSGLVVFQFAVSIALIISTIVVYRQLHFMQNKALGFDKTQALIINDGYLLGKNQQAFKEQIVKDSRVVSATLTRDVPVGSQGMDGTQAYAKDNADNETRSEIHINKYHVDYDYIKTLGMQMVSGRYFAPDYADSASVVLNEAAVKEFGFKGDPLGKSIITSGQHELTIIGVVKDFHYTSVKDKIAPLVMVLGNNKGGLIVKIKTAGVEGLLSTLKNDWNSFSPNGPFSYNFIDDRFAAVYKSEERTGKIFSVFAIISIIIASLGLLGLSAFSIAQRTKEIGVRKVLGANVSQVVVLLAKDFLYMVLIAFIVAVPLTWFAMYKWLQEFAYRINIGWAVFVMAGGIAIAIALITVSFQAIKAAIANPVKSLRTE
ncbi:ABC transporter permease [Ferruginibacter sp. SUN106]|uniref:ABC transporter permease n=1 Tax=Ferruginibacter sp. SUN106 TaxID=2978348 RepID=UPI003D35F143